MVVCGGHSRGVVAVFQFSVECNRHFIGKNREMERGHQNKKALVTMEGRGSEGFQTNRTACYFKSTLARTSGAHSGLILHQPCYLKQHDAE